MRECGAIDPGNGWRWEIEKRGKEGDALMPGGDTRAGQAGGVQLPPTESCGVHPLISK